MRGQSKLLMIKELARGWRWYRTIMQNFEYSIPEQPLHSQLDGLSEEAKNSLAEIDPINDVDEILVHMPNPEVRSAFESWAESQLTHALDGWNQYSSKIVNLQLPDLLEQLNNRQPNLLDKLDRLYNAKLALSRSIDLTPDNNIVGATMNLVLIPWGLFDSCIRWKNNDFNELLKLFRGAQGSYWKDNFTTGLLSTLTSDKPIYRQLNSPTYLVSAHNYLEERILKDGRWGIMLAQTTGQPGTKSMEKVKTSTLLSSANQRLSLEGKYVDAMGILEWLAMTIQENPNRISQTGGWLLANRIEVAKEVCVPYGFRTLNTINTYLSVENASGHAGPWLAVM